MNTARLQKRYGPWAVITGSSDGIGKAFAKQLAAAKLNVVLIARRAAVLEQVAEDLRKEYSVDVRVVGADLSKAEGLLAVDEQTRDLDVGLFVASAGFGTSGPVLQADLDVEHEMLEVNCFALLHGCVVFGNRLRQRRAPGGLILMSSLVGWQGTPLSANYAATKAYVQSLAESLRIELKPAGIDVLASAPGPVHSGFAARADMVMSAAVTPEAVAKATLAALGRRATVIPGALSKVLTWSLLPLPRAIRAQIMGKVMGGMTKHQQPQAAK
ncbi:Short-chain dehydrogenase/reductase SDR [Acidisarcina polymorpha]|uniref:Short-chain dehydrogenase/reductase SDR n=1 Tax=Acidisarcina polymorpha TaxID=2211140 RepID=A0A2Z5G531_9BACT|nr:SDR family NAD(P)-dependent oxidoreductase [Acidisarcina polymorpha]AXC13877.1 Short-chain dehydrogenase/reductase SDR [Acidisarcina polymorpha]